MKYRSYINNVHVSCFLFWGGNWSLLEERFARLSPENCKRGFLEACTVKLRQNINFYDGDYCYFSWKSSNKLKGHSRFFFLVGQPFVAYVPPIWHKLTILG